MRCRCANCRPAALLRADLSDPDIAQAVAQVAQADAIVVGTPVYKAAYSGVLKAFLDLLPQDGLAGKLVLPVATGGSQSHLLAIDYALRPVLASLAPRHILPSIYTTSEQLAWHPEHGLQPVAPIAARIDAGIEQLIYELHQAPLSKAASPASPSQPDTRSPPMTDRFEQACQRRHTLGLLFAAAAAPLAAGLARAAAPPREIRIGYQKYGTLTLLKGTRHAGETPGRQERRGALDRVPGRSGPAGRPERRQHRLRHGGRSAADLRPGRGREPGLCRQRAAIAGVRGHRGAEDLQLRSLADLKGRKIALNKGSNVHFLLVKALEKAGIAYADIQPVYLPPAEATRRLRARRRRCLGDLGPVPGRGREAARARACWPMARAWSPTTSSTWPRVRSPSSTRPGAHRDRRSGQGRRVGQQQPTGSGEHPRRPDRPAARGGGAGGARYSYGVKPITPQVLGEQQKIADAFHNLKLIPKPLVVRDAQPPAELLNQLLVKE
jgi:FMN reductase